jgi:hypothetical protein
MSVYLSLPLFMKPGQELGEGRPVTPEKLLALAADLHQRLSDAARVVELLRKRGWRNEMTLYAIGFYTRKGMKTKAQAEALLCELGIDPLYFAIEDDLDEEKDDVQAGRPRDEEGRSKPLTT